MEFHKLFVSVLILFTFSFCSKHEYKEYDSDTWGEWKSKSKNINIFMNISKPNNKNGGNNIQVLSQKYETLYKRPIDIQYNQINYSGSLTFLLALNHYVNIKWEDTSKSEIYYLKGQIYKPINYRDKFENGEKIFHSEEKSKLNSEKYYNIPHEIFGILEIYDKKTNHIKHTETISLIKTKIYKPD